MLLDSSLDSRLVRDIMTGSSSLNLYPPTAEKLITRTGSLSSCIICGCIDL
jgi:hypothetical protein